mmetsp:Transcript_10563/g.21820  ORF Transcript_10563/g.21820 Transcript_10563/m.21820 type:complete len:114 (+) Transcript_10563:39-380(+)
MGLSNIESVVTLWVATSCIMIMTLGAIPRILLTLNDTLGTTWFWNLNYGLGSYAFWAAEAGGLSLTFGAYPIILVAVYLFPQYSDLNRDGRVDEGENELFTLFPKEVEEGQDE